MNGNDSGEMQMVGGLGADAQAKANMDKALKLCNLLFTLIPPGCTIEYIVPQAKIHVVGADQTFGKLLVTKPALNVVVQTQRGG